MTVFPYTLLTLANTEICQIYVESEERQLPGEGYISVCKRFKETFCWKSSINSLTRHPMFPMISADLVTSIQ